MIREREEADDRLEELAVQALIDGVSEAEAEELEARARDAGSSLPQDLERIVAELTISLEPERTVLPATLRTKLLRSAQAEVLTASQVTPPRTPVVVAPRGGLLLRLGLLGYGVAAAGLLLVFLNTRSEASPVAPPTPAEAARQLAGSGEGLLRASFEAVAGNGYEEVTGEVLFRPDRQEGYMRFAGLPVNDPAVSQYQLWIVDPERDTKHPVDGGVFDVVATGEVVVPIRAALSVPAPTVFVITVEKPGGVVVSEGPFRLVAKVTG